MNNPANTPEPMPINSDESQPALWDLVIEDFERCYCGDEKTKRAIVQLMRDRDEFGVAKYGCHLKINNGRMFFNDLLSELLDAACYAKGMAEESKTFNDTLWNIYTDILKLMVELYGL